MAENLAKFVASRAGYRAHLTQTFKKASSIIQKESLTDSDIVSLNRIKEQLARKKTILQELDQKIAPAIEEPKEIEKEIFETEDILEQIEEAAAQISQSINNFVSTESSQVNPPHEFIQAISQSTNIQTPLNTTTNANPTTEVAQQNNTPLGNTQSEEVSQPPVVEQPQQEHQVNTPEDPPTLPATTPHNPSSFNQNSRLPKLNLPTFSGNPLQWFTFWDSFQAAVHSNTTLGDIQKFSYLKAQLTGDAARAISGFPLPNDNYTKAVQLLKERFGNASKVINAHMQSLLDLPNPKHELTSLQLFYDTMESHIRGLQSLGRSHSSYGDLLVPIVLGKFLNK